MGGWAPEFGVWAVEGDICDESGVVVGGELVFVIMDVAILV